MAALDTIAPEARERAGRIGEADLVVALPSCHTPELLDAVVAGLHPVLPTLLPEQKVVILCPDSAVASAEGSNEELTGDAWFQLFPYPLVPAGLDYNQSLDQGLRSLLLVGRTLGARTCVMMSSEACQSMPDGLRLLAAPVLNNEYDLAVSLYARRKFDALINSGIVYPLTRALYGARLHYPMAADLALSARLAEQYLQPSAAPGQPQSGWITTKAICAGFPVCEVYRDCAPTPIIAEPTELSASLAQVLGAFFLDMERNASFWQRVRGSGPLRAFGLPGRAEHESTTVDVHELIETFQRGCKDLLDVWAVALSPATMLELKKQSKLPAEQFRITDVLWVHIIYDFILGHRRRMISREQLLRSMTPIYLGWVAAYALEVQNSSPEAVEDRLERLCVQFEELKPYLLSRWRWPDRFNP